jgi:hypothetical protein
MVSRLVLSLSSVMMSPRPKLRKSYAINVEMAIDRECLRCRARVICHQGLLRDIISLPENRIGRGGKMSQGWVNWLVIISILLIVAGAITIFWLAATRRGGKRLKGRVAKPGRSAYRQVNPKTGDLFR